ncbi:hypothetical protein ACHQM5_014019 [Ranunculus cassubicifolius]
MTTVLQQKWITKLLAYNYEIIYKKGNLNIPADCLSRIHEDSPQCAAISVVQPAWVKDLLSSWEGDVQIQQLISALILQPDCHPPYSFTNGILRYKQKIFVGSQGNLRHLIWQELHNSGIGGHSGIKATFKRISSYFFWPAMRSDIQQWNEACVVFQTNKSEHVQSPGLLQPLPIPDKAWVDLSLDFIEGLPMSDSRNVILVVVDRFSKYAHFIPLKHPFSATTVAKAFLDQVFKLHGMPKTIVSDRGVVFLSTFWTKLFELVGSKLLYSTAYHPQSDGQTERVNQCVENFLRCLTSLTPTRWAM